MVRLLPSPTQEALQAAGGDLPSTYVRNLRNMPGYGEPINITPQGAAPVAGAAAPVAGSGLLGSLLGIGAAVAGGRELAIAGSGGRKVYATEAEREAAKPSNIEKSTLSFSDAQIKGIEKKDPIAAQRLREINAKKYNNPNFLQKAMGKAVETLPGFLGGEVVRKSATVAEPAKPLDPVNPVGPTPPPPPPEEKRDGLSGIKDFFWDKDKGGMTGGGLLTLGLLARAIAGQREKNAGMTGGGMESAGVGQAMTGAFQGMNERNRQLELDKLAREKIAADKDIAGIKAAGSDKEAAALKRQLRSVYAKQLETPGWTTEAELQVLAGPAGAGKSGPELRYAALMAQGKQGADQYWEDMVGADVPKPTGVGKPAGGAGAATVTLLP